jgi:hypothetical protein
MNMLPSWVRDGAARWPGLQDVVEWFAFKSFMGVKEALRVVYKGMPGVFGTLHAVEGATVE